MGDERLHDEALRHPAPGFALGAELARAYPALAQIEVDHLGHESYAQAGQCELVRRDDVYQQFMTEWSPQCISERGVNAWWHVTWQNHALQIVEVTWPGEFRERSHVVVLAASRATCIAFVDAVQRWNHEVRGEILVFADGCFQKDKALYASIKAASFDQLVLDGTLKEQLRDDFRQFLDSREVYESYGIPWKRGALLIGPPGNGKTLCVKSLVNALGIPCFYVRSFDSQQGTPQQAISQVFRRARATTPCLLVLEDIDSLLTDESRSFFLNELDGFATNTGVITVASTNHADRLDPAILERPSRFDRKYHFGLPADETRLRYIALWNERLRDSLRMPEDACGKLAELTEGFSFAYIQELFVSSMMRWISNRSSDHLYATAVEQVATLRSQMTSGVPATPPPPPAPTPRPWRRPPF